MATSNPKMMLANAYNNWKSKPASDICFLDKEGATSSVLRERGYNVITVDDVPRGHLILAMEAYKQNTDWSAFKPHDWDEAWATLFPAEKAEG